MFGLVVGVLLLGGGALSSQPERAPLSPPFPTEAALDANRIEAEYRRPIEARGVSPDWTARIEIGEARIRVERRAEVLIPLLTPYPCFVVGCEGVMIEQAVAHRHHGVSIAKQPCKLPGSEQTHPYVVSVSVLRSAADTRGLSYKGCGWPAPS